MTETYEFDQLALPCILAHGENFKLYKKTGDRESRKETELSLPTHSN